MKARTLYIGIDPGMQGYICVYDGEVIRTMWPMPYDGKRVDIERLHKIFGVLKKRGANFALVEEQQVFPKQGAVSAWTTASGYTAILCCLLWARIDYEEIRPSAWKSYLGLPSPKVEVDCPPKPESKGKLKAWAKRHNAAKKKAAAESKKIRKALAIRLAQKLQPHYDFRASSRARNPHDGKCEAYLIAECAYLKAKGD